MFCCPMKTTGDTELIRIPFGPKLSMKLSLFLYLLPGRIFSQPWLHSPLSFAYFPLSMIHFDFVLRIKSTKKYK